MYINPFVAGVICTLLVELLCGTIFVIQNVRKVTVVEHTYESENDNDQSDE